MSDYTDATSSPYTVDAAPALEAVPTFDDAPGTHGELVQLGGDERDQLTELTRDLLAKIAA